METATATQEEASTKASAADQKVLVDLSVLSEKMDKFDAIIRPTGGDRLERVPKSEAVLEVIGFLEACAPRMVELVEAAAQGALSELVLMKCLEVNDRLTKQLRDVEAITLTDPDDLDAFLNERASVQTEVAAAPAADS